MLIGVRLGIDVGKVRIGVAKSDPHGMLASPYKTIPRDLQNNEHVAAILEIVAEFNVGVVYVGNPINMSGESTLSTLDAQGVAQEIANTGVEVYLIDERLTTVTAQSRLHATGKNVKNSRKIIDQTAAAILLEQALEIERVSGKRAGLRLMETKVES